MRKDTPKNIAVLAKQLRNHQTKAEEFLWKHIRKKQLDGFRFQRQYCMGRYIADFYCSEANLVIEVDGSIHEEYKQIEYDTIRGKEIQSRQIKILRFKNREIFDNLEEVLNTIINNLKKL